MREVRNVCSYVPNADRRPKASLSLREARDLFVKAGIAWSEDRVPQLSAALSFYAILSLSPLLVLGITVLGFVINGAEHRILEGAQGFVGPQGAEFIRTMINGIHSRGAGIIATVSSLGVTFFSASNLFLQLQDSMGIIWKSRMTGPLIPTLIRTRVFAFFGVLIFGVTAISWLAIDSRLSWLAKHTEGVHLWPLVSLVVSVLILTVAAGVSFKALPQEQVTWDDVWPGAIVTALGFTLSKGLLSQYFAYAGLSAAYGISGAMVVILLWFYYSAQIYFFGAELTYAYAEQFGSRSKRPNAT